MFGFSNPFQMGQNLSAGQSAAAAAQQAGAQTNAMMAKLGVGAPQQAQFGATPTAAPQPAPPAATSAPSTGSPQGGQSPFGLHLNMPQEINLPGYNAYPRQGATPAAAPASSSPWDTLKAAGSTAMHDGGSFLSSLAAMFGA